MFFGALLFLLDIFKNQIMKLSGPAVLLIFLATITSFGQQRDVAALLQESAGLIQAGKFKEAEPILQRSVSLAPESYFFCARTPLDDAVSNPSAVERTASFFTADISVSPFSLTNVHCPAP